LDLCAAPGGKSFLVKSFLPKSKIVAIDKDAERIEMMNSNIKRLKLKILQLLQLIFSNSILTTFRFSDT